MGEMQRRTPWRFGRGFTNAELVSQLQALEGLHPKVPKVTGPEQGFANYYSEAVVAQEAPGPPVPGGVYQQACRLVAGFEFSDPRIVVGHFDPARPLLGRPLLLELKALGLRYLAGVLVTGLHEGTKNGTTIYGYRYETLPGHIETGSEWFLVSKQHGDGSVRLRIQASWRAGEFPNWWSRVGFSMVGRRYQRAWHRLAYLRMRRLLSSGPLPELPPRHRILVEAAALQLAPVQSLAGAQPRPDVAQETTVEPQS